MLDRQEAIASTLLGAGLFSVYGIVTLAPTMYFFGGGIILGMAAYAVIDRFRPKQPLAEAIHE